MTSIKRLLPILFAVIIGVIGLVLVRNYLKSQEAALEAQRQEMFADYQDPVSIVVARRPIKAGEIVTGEALAMFAVPPKFIVQQTATQRPEDLIGLQAKVPFSPGEQLLRDKFGEPEEEVVEEAPEGKLSLVTPPNKRAVMLTQTEIESIRRFVKPGDSVDISWIFNARGEPVNMTLFQGSQVLAVGDRLLGDPVKQEEAENKPRSKRELPDAITVALSPKEVGMLFYAREQGKIQVSLRSSMEASAQQLDVRPVDRAALMEEILQGDPYQVRGPHDVKICRGLDCSDVTLK